MVVCGKIKLCSFSLVARFESMIIILSVMIFLWSLDLRSVLVFHLKEARYSQTVPCLEESFHKYLGIFESNVFATEKMKIIVQQEFLKQWKVVLQTELNSGNKMKGIRIFAVPVIWYSAALLDWSITELNHLDIQSCCQCTVPSTLTAMLTNCISHKVLSLVDVVECEQRSLARYLCSARERLLLWVR